VRLCIAGSRYFFNKEEIFKIIDCYYSLETGLPSQVLCGCAPGVDRIGALWAEQHKIPIRFFPANWKKWGNYAGPKRNEEMAALANEVLVIRREDSKGSLTMIGASHDRGRLVHDIVIPKRLYPLYEEK
jgi:hypothetical protein